VSGIIAGIISPPVISNTKACFSNNYDNTIFISVQQENYIFGISINNFCAYY